MIKAVKLKFTCPRPKDIGGCKYNGWFDVKHGPCSICETKHYHFLCPSCGFGFYGEEKDIILKDGK